MSRLRVFPIVEGHGEVLAIRCLLERIWYELLNGEFIEILRPFRTKRQRFVKDKDQTLSKAVNFAAEKFAEPPSSDDPGLILILLDADDDPPCLLGPKVLDLARNARADRDISCVVANVEYETWFVAAGPSLSGYFQITPNKQWPDDPERQRCGKGWVKQHFNGTYSETLDQPTLTAQMNIAECRRRSPSFDKLCRDLEARMKSRTNS